MHQISSAPNPTGELTALPRPLAGFKEFTFTCDVREGRKNGREG